MVDPWMILGISRTADRGRIKKAYAARLKRAHPEDDPQGFQELRRAYEIALELAQVEESSIEGAGFVWREDAALHASWVPPPATPVPPSTPSADSETGERPQGPRAASGERLRPASDVSPPIPVAASPTADLRSYEAWTTEEAVEALMRDVVRLCQEPGAVSSEKAWRSLLGNDSLWSIDTRNEFQRELFEQLTRDLPNLSPAVWRLLEGEYRWTEQSLSFYRTLPSADVDRVMSCIYRAQRELSAAPGQELPPGETRRGRKSRWTMRRPRGLGVLAVLLFVGVASDLLRKWSDVAPVRNRAEQPKKQAFEERLARAAEYARMGRSELAEAIWKELAQERPEVAELHADLGYVYLQRSDWTAADDAFKEALRLEPDSQQARVGLGFASWKLGREDEAARIMAQVGRQHSQNAHSQYMVGLWAMGSGRKREAVKAFKNVLALTPDNAEANLNLASALLAEGRRREAIPFLETYVRLQPSGERADAARRLLATLARAGAREPESRLIFGEGF